MVQSATIESGNCKDDMLYAPPRISLGHQYVPSRPKYRPVFLKRIITSIFILSQSEEENEIRHRFRGTETSALSEGSSPTGGWQEGGEEEGEEAEAKKRLWIEKDPETNQIFRRIQQVSSHKFIGSYLLQRQQIS
jgi:hypothetical protein